MYPLTVFSTETMMRQKERKVKFPFLCGCRRQGASPEAKTTGAPEHPSAKPFYGAVLYKGQHRTGNADRRVSLGKKKKKASSSEAKGKK